MPFATYSRSFQAAGQSLSRSVVRSGSGEKAYSLDLPAADGGELTTRTSDTVGALTMDETGHGVTTGATVNLFWTGGVRYGVTVGTVSGTSVPFSGGSGDNLPAATTGVSVAAQVSAYAHIDGDLLQIMGIEIQRESDSETAQAHVQFFDDSPAQVAQVAVDNNDPTVYDIAGGDSNPFTGNPIAEIRASQGSTDYTGQLKILALEQITTTTTAAP